LGNAVQPLFLSAEERTSHYFLMLAFSFNTDRDDIHVALNSFKTKRKSCNRSSKDFVQRFSCRVSPLLRSVPLFFLMTIGLCSPASKIVLV